MARVVSYKYRETDSTVWISGSGGTSASIAVDVAAIKKPNATFNPNYNARIIGLNNTIGYLTSEGQTIPVSSSEELWVYRGYQTVGAGDTNAYNYNPYAHRPYKLYSVVTTQSGFPAQSWLPSGSGLFLETTTTNLPVLIPNAGYSPIDIQPTDGKGSSTTTTTTTTTTQFDMRDARVLEEVGNPTTQSYTTEGVSGSFEIFHPERQVFPFVWTRYIGGNFNPPGSGAQFVIRGQSGDFSGSALSLQQNQEGSNNESPLRLENQALPAGVYSYTSSKFDSTGGNRSVAYGSTVFGLYNQYGSYVSYKAENDASSPVDMKVQYTASNLTSSFFTLPAGRQHIFTALAGTPSQSSAGGALPDASIIKVQNNTAAGDAIPDLYAYKIDKVYASYSSSLSSSLDGIYIFNQIPQTPVEITSSIKVDAWTGSDPSSGAVYGSGSYGTSSYGAGELGDGNTWPTASIKIFKGNFPNFVPAVDVTGSLISTTSQSLLTSSTFHITQGSPTLHTMSYLMTESIFYRDCISMAITVESGSLVSSSVQNALFVKDYYLEFRNKPLVRGDGLVPTNFEGAFSGSLPFAKAEDCQPFLNNLNRERQGSLYMDVDYNTGIVVPTNFVQIINRTAQKADVQDSNYTTARITLPRYDGSSTTSADVNSIEALEGGYGLPPIDYQTGFFGYANEVTDPYPLVNGVTQTNIKYLVDGSGKAIQPNLSDWGRYDLESTYQVFSTDQTTGEIAYFNRARIAVNPDQQQTQYLALQGLHPLFKVAKRVEPVLYSQTSSAGYATDIPIGGFPGTVSNYSTDFTDYSMVAAGQAWTGDRDDKNFNIYPLAASQSVEPSTARNTASMFPLITGSGQTSVADLGVIKFVTDPSASSANTLSDNYNIQMLYQQPSTRPRRYRTKAGSFWKKSQYDSNVGSLSLRFMKSNSPQLASVTYVPITLVDPVRVKFWFGSDYVILNATSVFGAANVGLRNSNTEVRINISTNDITNVLFNASGKSYDDCTYVEFIINARSNQILRTDKYYAWRAFGEYDNENVDADKNRFNPTVTQQNGAPIYPVPNGPTTRISIQGSKTSVDSADNALNVPYWYFPHTDITGSALNPTDPDYFKIIQLSSSNGNALYGKGIQKTLPYSASVNTFFPGNFEPIDTTWPQQRLVWSVEPGDEIRFENNEEQTYKVESVSPPFDTQTLQGENQLRLVLNKTVDPSVNKDFFLIRRYVGDGSTLIFDTEFPYPGTAGNRKEFIINPGAYSGSGFQPATGSFVQVPPDPLKKTQLTTTAIIFPQFPTGDINNEPDLLLEALRNNKLIN